MSIYFLEEACLSNPPLKGPYSYAGDPGAALGFTGTKTQAAACGSPCPGPVQRMYKHVSPVATQKKSRGGLSSIPPNSEIQLTHQKHKPISEGSAHGGTKRDTKFYFSDSIWRLLFQKPKSQTPKAKHPNPQTQIQKPKF